MKSPTKKVTITVEVNQEALDGLNQMISLGAEQVELDFTDHTIEEEEADAYFENVECPVSKILDALTAEYEKL
jgi:hypothetical protein